MSLAFKEMLFSETDGIIQDPAQPRLFIEWQQAVLGG